MKHRNRRLRLEPLQRRDLCTVESLAWDGASSLRLSFVPDGTEVGDSTSDADFIFSQSAAGVDWQSSVARAFQVWAQYANINVGIVPDSGDPLGAIGPVRGDSRFGEIRVAGLAMADDTWAAAIDHEKLSAGTWAGDLIFNTAAAWNNDPEDLFKVALHEAGHILGLPHNADPSSPMFQHGIPSSVVPAASDIALLQQLYGTRGPDANEIAKPNDTIDDATRIRFSDDPVRFDGTRHLVHFGEIQSETDRDVFFLDVPEAYNGLVTMHVVSYGFSMLQYRFQLTDRDGNELDLLESAELQGGDLAITVDTQFAPSKLYLHVEPIGDAKAQLGSYAVIVELEGSIQASYDDILRAAQIAHRWFAESDESLTDFDVNSLLDEDVTPVLNNDNGLDDAAINAPRVEPYVDSSSRRSAIVVGTITSATDVDSYRFRSPRPGNGKTFGMLVQVDAIEREQLIASIEVLNSDLAPIGFEKLVDGNGQILLWVNAVEENKDYTVRIKAGPGKHSTGNYELTATFQETKPVRNILVSTELTGNKSESEATLYVARPQLFNLAVASRSPSNDTGQVWINIYDQNRVALATLATAVDSLRTGPSLLLQPGTYYLQFGTQRSGVTATDKIVVELSGDVVTNPLGPPPVNPGTAPVFSCPSTPAAFCYPNNVQTPVPYLVGPAPAVVLPTTKHATVVPPIDTWFWNPSFPRTNSLRPTDTNGDGMTSPLDALLIIDMLNQRGSGPVPAPPIRMPMNDVNADGNLSPLDVLLVVDILVRQSRGSGEGESPSYQNDLSWESQNTSSPALPGVSSNWAMLSMPEIRRFRIRSAGSPTDPNQQGSQPGLGE